LLKLLKFNLISNLEGIFNFLFQNLLLNIGECKSRFKHTDMICRS
jgi:hypothetical protein